MGGSTVVTTARQKSGVEPGEPPKTRIRPCVRPLQAGDAAQQGGLADAVLAGDADAGAGRHGQSDVHQDRRRAVADEQAVDLDRGMIHHSPTLAAGLSGAGRTAA